MKDFTLVQLRLQWFRETLYTAYLTVIAFMVRDIFPLEGLYGGFKDMSLNIKASVSYDQILFFVLTPTYGCFRVTCVSIWMELHTCHWEP